jgi:hypothetical protein
LLKFLQRNSELSWIRSSSAATGKSDLYPLNSFTMPNWTPTSS